MDKPPRYRKKVNRADFSVLMVKAVPRDLKAKYKATCGLRGDTMEEVMLALMEYYVKWPERITVRKKGRLGKFDFPYTRDMP